MPYLKLFREEVETEAPQPLPFNASARSWRTASEAGHDSNCTGEVEMDSIARVEEALSRVESNFESLSEQVEEYCQPLRMSDWLDTDDDGPFAA
ncbi:MAG: hypothetical protein P1U42_01445 [Phycisphaerales bacterium]|jgi:hypothetical protein|nr:hypothetical protein [Phycisphaerales bacterium]